MFVQLCLMTVLIAGVPNFHHRSATLKHAAGHPVANATARLRITAFALSLCTEGGMLLSQARDSREIIWPHL